jgi:hypothetical protein
MRILIPQQKIDVFKVVFAWIILASMALLIISCSSSSSQQPAQTVESCLIDGSLKVVEIEQLFKQNIGFDIPPEWTETRKLTYEKDIQGNIGLLSLLAFKTTGLSSKDCVIEMMQAISMQSPIDGYTGKENNPQIGNFETYMVMLQAHDIKTNSPIRSVLLGFSDSEYVYLFIWDIFGDDEILGLFLSDVMNTIFSIHHIQ